MRPLRGPSLRSAEEASAQVRRGMGPVSRASAGHWAAPAARRGNGPCLPRVRGAIRAAPGIRRDSGRISYASAGDAFRIPAKNVRSGLMIAPGGGRVKRAVARGP